MKKITLLTVVLAAMTLGSCKKDYTCECCVTGSGSSVCGSATYHDTKKNAKASCDKGTATVNGVSTSCSIK
jgi:uncharacterized membrane protein YadS